MNEKERFYTIEVYNHRRWSDKHSCTYSTKEDAEDRARELYGDQVDMGSITEPIFECYRIKETIMETFIYELE